MRYPSPRQDCRGLSRAHSRSLLPTRPAFMARRSERARPRSLSSALTRGGGLCGNCRAATTQAFGRETSVLPRGSGRAAATPGGAGEGWPSPNQLLTLLPSPWLTMVGIRSEAAAAPRGGARRDRPHPPAPSPIAMGEGEKLIRGRAKPSPGPPDCRGAAASRSIPTPVRSPWERGRGVRAVPTSPAARCGGRFRTDTYHCQPAHGERGARGEGGPGAPGRSRYCPCCAATCRRRRSSCSCSSGVNASPKSSAVTKGRISISDSPGIGFGQRLTHAMASAIDGTSQTQ